MAVRIKGQVVDLPWNDDFDNLLMRLGDDTYKYSGDQLLHAIHKDVIEAKYISLKLYAKVQRRLIYVLLLQVVIFAFVLFK